MRISLQCSSIYCILQIENECEPAKPALYQIGAALIMQAIMERMKLTSSSKHVKLVNECFRGRGIGGTGVRIAFAVEGNINVPRETIEKL